MYPRQAAPSNREGHQDNAAQSLEKAGEVLERLCSTESPRHANRKPGKWGTPMLFFASTENFASNKVL